MENFFSRLALGVLCIMFPVISFAATVVSSPETATISARVGTDEIVSTTGSYPFGSIPITPEVVVAPTTISFSGTLFGFANVVVLQDGQNFLSGYANSQGNFFLIQSGLTPGVYTYGVFIELPSGKRILIHVFHVTIKLGMYTKIENITLSQFLWDQIFPTTSPVVSKNYCTAVIADLNCDGRVDIIDLSILEYWYRSKKYSASKDLNGDKQIELGDFSVLAYYWTG